MAASKQSDSAVIAPALSEENVEAVAALAYIAEVFDADPEAAFAKTLGDWSRWLSDEGYIPASVEEVIRQVVATELDAADQLSLLNSLSAGMTIREAVNQINGQAPGLISALLRHVDHGADLHAAVLGVSGGTGRKESIGSQGAKLSSQSRLSRVQAHLKGELVAFVEMDNTLYKKDQRDRPSLEGPGLGLETRRALVLNELGSLPADDKRAATEPILRKEGFQNTTIVTSQTGLRGGTEKSGGQSDAQAEFENLTPGLDGGTKQRGGGEPNRQGVEPIREQIADRSDDPYNAYGLPAAQTRKAELENRLTRDDIGGNGGTEKSGGQRDARAEQRDLAKAGNQPGSQGSANPDEPIYEKLKNIREDIAEIREAVEKEQVLTAEGLMIKSDILAIGGVVDALVEERILRDETIRDIKKALREDPEAVARQIISHRDEIPFDIEEFKRGVIKRQERKQNFRDDAQDARYAYISDEPIVRGKIEDERVREQRRQEFEAEKHALGEAIATHPQEAAKALLEIRQDIRQSSRLMDWLASRELNPNENTAREQIIAKMVSLIEDQKSKFGEDLESVVKSDPKGVAELIAKDLKRIPFQMDKQLGGIFIKKVQDPEQVFENWHSKYIGRRDKKTPFRENAVQELKEAIVNHRVEAEQALTSDIGDEILGKAENPIVDAAVDRLLKDLIEHHREEHLDYSRSPG